ncbi:MogA/MoaB family molybdenum cofactor biosynthesis protein [Geomonas anaerohicana]|uniref:Molybdopterin adenylyltransferase n=1 Tax=Geomonas anaerohicana TaxID=2798583 RepID=A0ABS0YCV8_9BACT|nr:MogA/MoaB family molybdenum cofactor biosynthesis protein [Geomonas anaerohicana]MBJ6750129.1 MogA/MoaB family molybdenum cofactor biosynthesis protein [Geomonas anaerohicana]
MRAAILTLSDRCSTGERADGSGPALRTWLEERGVTVACTDVIPDEGALISAKLTEWADSGLYDLILTTGGTGVSPRDVTPEATERVVERLLPGFGEVMRMESLKKTPHAIISRAVAGIRKNSLIINLPGSPKGATENIGFVWAAVPHAVAKLQGDPEECGTPLPR